jgi:hypothetical protein
VAEPTFVALWERRIAFKISARQIVEQHVKFYAKECRPSLVQKLKEVFFMSDQRVQTPIKSVFGRNGEVLCEQITHRRLLKPYSVKAPLTSRIQ